MGTRSIAECDFMHFRQIEQSVDKQICPQMNEIAAIWFKQNGSRHANISEKDTRVKSDIGADIYENVRLEISASSHEIRQLRVFRNSGRHFQRADTVGP